MRSDRDAAGAAAGMGTALDAVPGLTISARSVARTLGAAIGALVSMHAAVHIGHFVFGHDHLLGLTPLFDLNRENNVPSWYSGAVMLATSAVLGAVARAKHQQRDRFTRHWAVLAVIFAYLSFDELMSVHELWGQPLNAPLAGLRNPDVAGGMLRNLWVLPAGLLAVIVGVSYLRFLAHLPHRTRVLFVASGIGFVLGAVGMEMAGAVLSSAGLRESARFMVLVAVEETLEMGSIAAFLYAVLDYCATLMPRVHLTIR